MNGMYLSLVGLHFSIVGGFWIVSTNFTTAIVTNNHYVLLWGGLVLTLASLFFPSQTRVDK